MKHQHTESGRVYEVLHIADWLPFGPPKDNEDVLIMRDMGGEVKVQLASQSITAGCTVIAGGQLQVAEEKVDALTQAATVVVYLGAEGRVFAREIGEFNTKFTPPVAVAENVDNDASSATPTTARSTTRFRKEH